MNANQLETAVARRCQQLETALLTGKSLPSQGGDWRTGDLLILISVATKVLRDRGSEGSSVDVQQLVNDVLGE